MAIGFVKYVPIALLPSSYNTDICTSAFANLSSVYGSYIWPSGSAPEYVPGFSVTTILMFLCIITALLLMILTKKYPYENTKDGKMGMNTQSANQESNASSETVG